MRKIVWTLGGVMVVAGCADNTPPPPRAAVPPVGTYTTVPPEPGKPVPTNDPVLANLPPYADEPIVSQAVPEAAAFAATYERVGRPRMTVFVNRTLAGRIVATKTPPPADYTERVRTATGAVDAEVTQNGVDYWGRPVVGSTDRFKTQGPAEVRDRTSTVRDAGPGDDVGARPVDYAAVESVLGDWLSAGGRVSLVSARLTEGQTRKLQSGDTNALTELAAASDVLVQVQALPTGQTPQGTSVRLIAEAMNTRGGDSLGRAFVDVPPPLEKQQINEYTRFLARKLMSDMTQTWNSPRPPGQGQSGQASPPAVPPTAVPPATAPATNADAVP